MANNMKSNTIKLTLINANYNNYYVYNLTVPLNNKFQSDECGYMVFTEIFQEEISI